MPAKTAATRKAKGRAFEWEICRHYMDIGLVKVARPMPESGALKELPGDIMFVDEVNEFSEEAKRSETVQLWGWLKQAEKQADETGKHPALHFRRNRSKAYTIIPFEVFASLRLELEQLRRGIK